MGRLGLESSISEQEQLKVVLNTVMNIRVSRHARISCLAKDVFVSQELCSMDLFIYLS